MPMNNLIAANVGAASLHGLLLVALVVYYFINNPDKISVFLFDEGWDLSNDDERCECWAPQGYFTTNSEINLLTMTLIFTIITFIAHVFYASNISNLYLSAIESGKNPYRWIEYGASASIMLGILSILAGNRNRNLFILTIIATFAQMLQGYSIESAVANDGSAVDRLVPLVAGWALLAGAWYAVYHKWYDGMAQAFDNYDYCKENTDDYDTRGGKPPEFISHLINVVFVMFASFGFVNLAYVVNSFIGDAKSNFKIYELSYISLSFIAKAILIIWCMSSIFNGELEWLQNPGSLDEGGELLVSSLGSVTNSVETPFTQDGDGVACTVTGDISGASASVEALIAVDVFVNLLKVISSDSTFKVGETVTIIQTGGTGEATATVTKVCGKTFDGASN